MPPTPESVADVASAIELALAPVFLLTGIAGMLTVMTNRLSRIIDRVRVLTEGERAVVVADLDSVAAELESLESRRHFVGIAITACTIAALLLCVDIATLFLEVMLNAPLNWLIGTLFTASTLALIVGLAYFLREVHLATQTGRIAPPRR